MKQALIFAAGLGTRLRPITDSLPKALVEVAGKPLLAHVIDRLTAEGYNDIVVNVHHFADKVIDYIRRNYADKLNVNISDERELLLETGGGIKHAQHFFSNSSPILIHNVDILSNANLTLLYDKSGTDATLLVSKRSSSRYLLFDDDMKLVGWTNINTGEIRSPYDISDVNKYKQYAFSGIHSFSPTLFQDMDDYPERFKIIDFYLDVCAKRDIVGVEQSDLQLLDVGKLDSLQKAEAFITGHHSL